MVEASIEGKGVFMSKKMLSICEKYRIWHEGAAIGHIIEGQEGTYFFRPEINVELESEILRAIADKIELITKRGPIDSE